MGRSWSLLPALPACLPACLGSGAALQRYGDGRWGIVAWFGREEGQDQGCSLMDKPPPAKNCGRLTFLLRRWGCAVCPWLGSRETLGLGCLLLRPECLVMCCNLPSCSLLSLFFLLRLGLPDSCVQSTFLLENVPSPPCSPLPSKLMFPPCLLSQQSPPSSVLHPGPGFSVIRPPLFVAFIRTLPQN